MQECPLAQLFPTHSYTLRCLPNSRVGPPRSTPFKYYVHDLLPLSTLNSFVLSPLRDLRDCPPPRTKQDATPAPMEKGGSGKLSKLKCMIKRWNSSGRIARSTSAARGGGAEGDGASLRTSPDEERWKSASFHGDAVPPGFHAVYVGKSRRRYLVNSGLVDHPLFRVLVERCSVDGDGGADAATVVGCEVVLFEHLLWMLENADPQPESLDELVDFYAC
ncbi:auxin-responsive protein SAUR76-like [Canna indica]|uniref:Auxin-responsive protein SAUR76-like n=1 Tax=Canna indica TaxID=4628 RepID=A0AAQ3JLF5_9LILI|nr:auxin-responsive protein SAUR76-like [Canna indica]